MNGPGLEGRHGVRAVRHLLHLGVRHKQVLVHQALVQPTLHQLTVAVFSGRVDLAIHRPVPPKHEAAVIAERRWVELYADAISFYLICQFGAPS